MGTIMESNPQAVWRQSIQPASFDNCEFYCEVGSWEGGQRLVVHEYPKRDSPYTEFMGRRHYSFTVRAYCVQSARRPDYRPMRDRLRNRLDEGRPGTLQLPLMRPMTHVACRQYRLTEEQRLGGYCVFDIQFVEASEPPFKPTPSPEYLLRQRALELLNRTLVVMSGQP